MKIGPGQGGPSTITNGGRVVVGNTSYVGQNCNNNAATVAAGGVWDMNNKNLYVGFKTGNTNNRLLIATGGTVTNIAALNVGDDSGANGNSVIATNGGSLYMNGALNVGGKSSGNLLALGNSALTPNTTVFFSNGGNNNTIFLFDRTTWHQPNSSLFIACTTAGGSGTGNVVRIESGAAITRTSNLYVGTNGACAGNSLIVGPGGYAATPNTAQAGGGAGNSNTIQVLRGGILEAGTLLVGAGVGNLITNEGGVYQFTTTTPTITPNGAGRITLNNGVIAFRNVSGVNVTNNWGGSDLTNIAFSGANAFRLNNATNSAVASQPQTYTFNATANPANYAGLEMVNGGTAYTNGSVTIGSLTSTNGWLTCSNTTATLWGAVTNYGTMRIIDSTVVFKSNLVLGASCSLLWSSNSVGNTVTVNGTLTLPASASLTFSGTLPAMDGGVTLLQSSNTISGSAAAWSVLPSGYAIRKSADGKALVLRATLVGTYIMLR